SHGDLRDNAHYDAARNDQGMLEARIRQPEDPLRPPEDSEATPDATDQIGTVATVVEDDRDVARHFVATPESTGPAQALAPPGRWGAPWWAPRSATASPTRRREAHSPSRSRPSSPTGSS